MSTTLSDVILAHIKNNVREINTTIPATVTDVSKLTSDNRVSVQPALDIVDSDGVVYTLPLLSDIPVQWPSGGGAVMTFPLAVGDDVLVVFSMRSISEFMASTEGTVQPFDNRLHNLSDGFVLPCIYRNSNQPSPSSEDVELRYGDGQIKIEKDGTVSYFNANGSQTLNADGTHVGVASETWSMTNGTGELIDLLTQTLQAISDTTVNTIYGASPLNTKPAIDTLIEKVESFKE